VRPMLVEIGQSAYSQIVCRRKVHVMLLAFVVDALTLSEDMVNFVRRFDPDGELTIRFAYDDGHVFAYVAEANLHFVQS
jgi:hypothetical protein